MSNILANPLLPPVDPKQGEDTTQLELMIAGEPYLGRDKYLERLRTRMFAVLERARYEPDGDKRQAMFKEVIEHRSGPRNGGAWGLWGFMCEYGFNISLGDEVYIGPSCTFLDVAPIYIGDRTLIGANCQFYTPTHPILPEERDGIFGPEAAKPITIGNDCWLGGSVIIVPGVTIGDGCTIGAGSVVTKDIPPRSVAVGNPAKVIRTLPPAEKK